jgi:hypothetical protein
VEGASVTAKSFQQYRGPKGVAFKFKRRRLSPKPSLRRGLTTLEIRSRAISSPPSPTSIGRKRTGSVKSRDSRSQRLGVKKFGSQ